jgi:hypothetical protein
MLRRALEHVGYLVDVAFAGPSALSRVASFQPSNRPARHRFAGDGRVRGRTTAEGFTLPALS